MTVTVMRVTGSGCFPAALSGYHAQHTSCHPGTQQLSPQPQLQMQGWLVRNVRVSRPSLALKQALEGLISGCEMGRNGACEALGSSP